MKESLMIEEIVGQIVGQGDIILLRNKKIVQFIKKKEGLPPKMMAVLFLNGETGLVPIGDYVKRFNSPQEVWEAIRIQWEKIDQEVWKAIKIHLEKYKGFLKEL